MVLILRPFSLDNYVSAIESFIKITDPEMAEKWGFLKDESSHILYLTDISATLLLLLAGEIHTF